MCNDIVGRALNVRNGIDAVIFVDGLYFRGERGWVPETIRRAGIPTVLIATDDPYDQIQRADVWYTFRFTNELHSATEGARYLPTASTRPPIEPAASSGTDFDLVFVGTLFEDRWPLVRELAYYCEDQRLRLLLAGNLLVDVDELADFAYVTIEKQAVRADKKWSLYARSKLVLNLFRETEHPAASPNPRVFEVTALGGPALISGKRRTEVTRIFGDSVYQFDDLETLKSQITAAVENDEDRETRVAQAKQITRDNHLYDHRAQELLREIKGQSIANGSTATEEQLTWIFGCGRTGSSWLVELLGATAGRGGRRAQKIGGLG